MYAGVGLLRWVVEYGDWNTGRWANGAGDVGCLLFGNGWVGESEYAGTINTTITQTTMNNNVVRATNTAGRVFFGKGIISNSNGGILPTDNGSIVQVQGPISATMFASGLAANTDWTGEALLSAATSIAVSVSGAYGSHLRMFRGTPVRHRSGQPALDHVRGLYLLHDQLRDGGVRQCLAWLSREELKK